MRSYLVASFAAVLALGVSSPAPAVHSAGQEQLAQPSRHGHHGHHGHHHGHHHGQSDGSYARHAPRPGVTDQDFYFVMGDRFENGDPSNDQGGLTGDPLVTGFDPTAKGFYN